MGQAPDVGAAAGERPYPDPPWHTQGFGVFCPFVVRTRDLKLPSGLEPVGALGRTAGLLAYIEYQPPSPLTYSELIWMPALVRMRGGRAKGYHVARMYVDDTASLQAGRELWKLPKTLAEFTRRGDVVDVVADDGTELTLQFAAKGPSSPISSSVRTLQAVTGGAVRFRGDVSGRVRAASARITRFESEHSAWDSLRTARRVGKLAAVFERFEATMHPPSELR